MKLLLTSAGIKNPSIHAALLDLLGKPIAESTALCISTSSYALRRGPSLAWRFISFGRWLRRFDVALGGAGDAG